MSTNKEQFYADSQTFLDETLEEQPVMATDLGDHRHDDRLGDYTQAALDRRRERAGWWLERFGSYDAGQWPIAAQVDQTLMVQITKSAIRQFDKIRGPYRNPGAVVDECLNGIYLLTLRDFAPLPVRMKGILGRLRETPRLLNEGRALVVLQEVPKIWAEIALESAQHGLGLVAGLVPTLTEMTPELKAEVLDASRRAATALQEQAAWIEKEVLPQAAGDFAVGRELFDEILREDHMVDYDSRQLLATGWQLYEDTRRQIKELAAQINPDKTAEELLEEAKRDHPAAGDLLETYRRKMAEARQFVIDHEIATIPPGETIRVEPTPTFLRPTLPFAAYMLPGFLEKKQEGVFIVTPVEEGADAEAAEKKLRAHLNSEIPVTALHEAYPGHHLQLSVANTIESLPRKMGSYLSQLFIEGWAFYCEEMMEQLGFIALPIQRLSRLEAQLWRASRIIIDSSLQTGEMTVEEAIAFLVERAGLEPGDARAEVRRYTLNPTQPQCYLMGKLQILDIVAEYRRRYPGATMRQMHDAILGCGSLPPRLMRLSLFGGAGR